MAEETEKKGRNVVIAIDGSEHAKYAYQWYLSNVRQKDDHVYLVHAVEINEVLATQQFASPFSFDPDVLATVLKQEKERVTAELQQYAELLTETGMNGTVKSVHTSNPGEGIVQAAKDVQANMIVCGSRGLGTLRRTLLGSNSDYILHHAHVPVIICRHH